MIADFQVLIMGGVSSATLYSCEVVLGSVVRLCWEWKGLKGV